MTTHLSKDSEKRLLRAVEKAADHVSTGMHPNDALVKSAAEFKIPAGHIHLMVEAINTGRTNAARMAGTDPVEKAAAFPVASTSVVLHELYPDSVETKQALYLNAIVATDYNAPPKFIAEKKRMDKAAAAINWKLTDKKLEIETDPFLPMKKACAQIRRSMIDVEEKRRHVSEVREGAMKLAAELSAYFLKPGHINFDEVKDNSAIMFGKQAEAVLSVVDQTKRQKISSQREVPVDINAAPYSLIRRAIKAATDFKNSQEAYKAAADAAQHESADLLRPFVQKSHTDCSVLASLCSGENLSKTGGLIGDIVGKGFGMLPMGDVAKQVGKSLPGLPHGDHQRDLQGLMDPAHEMEIRNIQSEALLNDLLANDDVVRGYHPDDVIDAYNEVSQLAPYASNKKAIIRDLLRKRLTGGAQALDQFVVSDALNTQERLKNMHSIPPSSLNVLKDVGVLPGVSQTHSKSVIGS